MDDDIYAEIMDEMAAMREEIRDLHAQLNEVQRQQQLSAATEND